MPPDALALIRRAKAEAKTKAQAENSAEKNAAPPPPLALQQLPSLPPALAAPSLPANCVHYVPDFISVADEELLLQHILGPSNAHRWSPGNGRRTQNYGGDPSVPELTEELPSWLQQLNAALVRSGAWPIGPGGVSLPPNHVIINEYTDGRTGLTPHTDGPLYATRVAVLSLMSDVVLELHTPCDQAVRCEAPTRLARMLLRPRSLNVLDAEAYRLFHGIRAAEADTVTGESSDAADGQRGEGRVVNSREAGVGAEGETISRKRRVSIVFVCKLPELC
jgi:alkylated DNA repair protein alkB homolog 6